MAVKPKKKLAVTKKLTVKKGSSLIDMPIETVKALLADVGFAGNLLGKAANDVFKEAKKMARAGVVNATDFEKALIKGVKNTNDVAAGTTKKLAKRLLR